MKIGILTFHRAENFGATLQCYALQRFLQTNGFDVQIIDYRCKSIEMSYHIYNPRILLSRKNIFASLKAYLKRYTNLADRNKRKEAYHSFWRENYNLSPMAIKGTIKKEMDYDIYITGSDQVWNPHLTGGINPNYFIDFPIRKHAKRIAYAASSEHDPKGILYKNHKEIGALLDKFDAISVREQFLKDELSRYCSKDISICLDPTFLLQQEDYKRICSNTKRRHKYILVYHMTYSPSSVSLAEQLAKEKGAEIIEVYGGYTRNNTPQRCKTCTGPSQLLDYLINAETVITTSFHGLALSLILEKDVHVINHKSNYRQQNLIDLADIRFRLVEDIKSYDHTIPINYTKVRNKLSKEIEKSKRFLLDSILS